MTAEFLFPPTARVRSRKALQPTAPIFFPTRSLRDIYRHFEYLILLLLFFFFFTPLDFISFTFLCFLRFYHRDYYAMSDRNSPEIPREPPLETDLYDILGVSQDAKSETIKSAYKKLALKHHPGTSSPTLLDTRNGKKRLTTHRQSPS